MTAPKLAEAQAQFGLPKTDLERLKQVFTIHPDIQRVVLYGSRAKGNYRHNSDIDLMIAAPALSWSEFTQIEIEIDDLLLPWKVDLALEHHIENQALLDHVARRGIRVV